MGAGKPFTPFRREVNDLVIPWGSKVSGVLNTALNASTYTAITMPADTYCKYILAQTADYGAWLFSDILAGTTFFSIAASQVLALNIAGVPGQVLFYAKDGNATPNLQVILID